ncbi:hypothetical protein LIER_15502 [Lithospermum erythrorhizon]|uniref:Uncharacterized protein n=1 Tax=Lithospermum erythrorhizon TaxID=34254 RepID=A0AAV3Q357_LITER
MTRPSAPVTKNPVDENMANHLTPSVGNVDQVLLNKKSESLPIEQQVCNDIPGTLQPPQVIPPTYKFPMEGIREEVQRRVHIARQQEIQRPIDQILERDRLVHENRDRLAEAAARAEEAYVPRKSYTTEDSPYTPTYSSLYTNSMLLEYGDTRSHYFVPSIVQQTVPRIDPNAVMLQELLAAQKREFVESKQTVLASLSGRENRAIPQAVMPFTTRGFKYGKLKKALILDTPPTKDELTRVVNKHIDLENLQRKKGPRGDICEKLNRKYPQGPLTKTQNWDRL